MEYSCVRYVLTFLTLLLESSCQYLSNDVGGGKGPRVVSLTVRSDILYRFAETVITSTVVNELYDARETTFDVSLPMAAFTSNFTLEIDGIIYPGIVKEKQAAKMTYEKAKRKGQTAAHMFYNKFPAPRFQEYIDILDLSDVNVNDYGNGNVLSIWTIFKGLSQTIFTPRDTNKFRVTINVAAQSEVTFVLTYNELLQRKRGQYEHVIYIDPKQVVDQLLVEVFIYESREITALRIPPVRNDILENSFEFPTSNELALVERPSSKTAYIRYNPSPEEQKRDSIHGISGLFKVQYDVQRSLDAGDIYVVDGYFTHFFAPVGLRPLRKRILFVLDVSGSMGFSRKIEQLKGAMTQILKELNEDDLFNVVTFASSSHPWSTSMRLANPNNLEQATHYVQNLEAEGGTNVNDALIDALKILQGVKDVGVTAPIVVFLTDGDPTVGVTSFKKILNNVQSKNKEKIQIFSLAFGEDANFNFLKKVSARNNAFARKIYADADATLQLTGFYNEISNVLLSKISFTYLNDAVNMTSVTQSQFPSFFDGSELVVSGRLNEFDGDFNSLTLTVVGSGVQGILEMSATTDIVQRNNNLISDFKTRLEFSTITEKSWAYLTIKKLLEEELKTENSMLREEIRRHAVSLAIKYNFVTPVTSMVVTKPESKKDTSSDHNVQEDDAHALEADDEDDDPGTAALSSSQLGLTGKNTITYPTKAMADNDPHFIVNVKGLDYAICFDVMGDEGDVYQLIKDKYSGLQVDAKVVANKQVKDSNNVTSYSHPGEIKTFLGEITIKRRRFVFTITPTKLTLMGETIDWTNGTALSHGKTKVVVDQGGSMVVVIFNDRVALLIMRHLKPKSLLKRGKVHFLGLYIVDYKGLSYHTHGLLGQFLHRSIILKKTKNRKGKLMGRLRVTGNTSRPRKVMATLGHRLNLATNKTVSCWMVQHNGGALLDGNITDYLIKRKHSEDSNKQHTTDVNEQNNRKTVDEPTDGDNKSVGEEDDSDMIDTTDVVAELDDLERDISTTHASDEDVV